MTDRAELIEICKIAQHQGGPQNLSAVGIGRYLRLCSPEVVLALFDEIEALRRGMKGDYDLDAWLDWTKEAGALRDKVEHLECMTENHKIDAGVYRAELEACAAVLPCSHYMDPPDGGDVSVPEQLRRMAKDAARLRWLRSYEFDIGSFHDVQEHNHKAWFEHISDESIDLAIAEESQFAADNEVTP